MLYKRVLLSLLSAFLLLALPGTCAAAVELGSPQMIYENLWYKPELQPSAEAAMGTIRNLGASKKFAAWNGYDTIFEVDVDPYGLRVRGVLSGVQTQGQWVPSYGGSWVGGKYIPYNGGSYQTTQTPYQKEERAIVDFRKVVMVDLQHYPNIDREYKWGVVVRYGAEVVAFRAPHAVAAQELADSIATLAVAAGARLYTPSGAFYPSDMTDNDKQRKQLKWTADSGAVVTGVQPGSPAAAAGLRANDVIVEANGAEVKDANQWRGTVQAALGNNPDAKFALGVFRDGNLVNIALTVANFNYWKGAAQQPGQQAAAAQKPALGVEVLQLTADEAKAAGVAGGVRLVAVYPDGLAAKSQLKANDVLLEVNGKPVPDTATLKQVLAAETPRQFKVLRDGAAVVLEVPQSL